MGLMAAIGTLAAAAMLLSGLPAAWRLGSAIGIGIATLHGLRSLAADGVIDHTRGEGAMKCTGAAGPRSRPSSAAAATPARGRARSMATGGVLTCTRATMRMVSVS